MKKVEIKKITKVNKLLKIFSILMHKCVEINYSTYQYHAVDYDLV